MKTGIELIAEERQRQISQEGWTPEHDDQHTRGELADAAASYAGFSAQIVRLPRQAHYSASVIAPPSLWPWSKEWWKPKCNVHDLARAGALIAAEIDRLQRRA